MTLEEINGLKIKDVESLLLQRLELSEDPKDGTLENEFEVYQSELIKSLKEEIKQRLSLIKDPVLSLSKTSFMEPNYKIAFKKIIETCDNDKLIEIESASIIADQEIQDSKDKDMQKLIKINQAKQEIKNLDWSSVTTIASLKVVLKNVIELISND